MVFCDALVAIHGDLVVTRRPQLDTETSCNTSTALRSQACLTWRSPRECSANMALQLNCVQPSRSPKLNRSRRTSLVLSSSRTSVTRTAPLVERWGSTSHQFVLCLPLGKRTKL